MNKETKRQFNLFNLLINQDGYRPTHYFSSFLQVSEKTLYNDIINLNVELKKYELEIQKIPRKGLLLIGEMINVERFKKDYFKENVKSGSSIERQRLIAKQIFLGYKDVSLIDLEEQFCYSDACIRNDILALRKYFENKGVKLVNENGNIHVEGDQRKIQNAYKSYENDFLRNAGLVSYENIKKKEEEIFDYSIIETSEKIVNQFVNKSSGLSEVYQVSLWLSLCILLTRVRNGKHVKNEVKNFVFKDIETMESYITAMNISMSLIDSNGIIFEEQDTAFLSEILYSCGIELPANSFQAPISIKNAIDKMINCMSTALKLDLSDDQKLYDVLLAHIPPMIYRLKNGFIVRNPLLTGIKKQYMVMFTLTWYACCDFEELFDIRLSDDEVSFLTIYFQVAYTRKRKPKNILIVCPHGLASSELVYSQIKDMISAKDHLEIATIDQLYSNDISNVEFIISLVGKEKLEGIDKKIIYVSPLLTQDDVDNISQYYRLINKRSDTLRNVANSNYIELTKYFDDELLYWQCDFTSKQQVLDFMISKYEEKGIVNKGFRDSIYDREAEGITSLATGVALPHASSKTVKKTLLSIMTLKKPIKWSENDVDTIIMIAVAEEDVDQIREVIAKLANFTETKNNINLLSNIKSNYEFAILLQESSR